MTEWNRTGSLQEVGNRFRFPGHSVPVKSAAIWKNVRKYQREGTNLNLNILVQSQIIIVNVFKSARVH